MHMMGTAGVDGARRRNDLPGRGLLRALLAAIRGERIMSKTAPTVWYNGGAEEAARFYVTLLPDSRIEAVNRSPTDTPSGPAGMGLTVIFALPGPRFCALNGGRQ